MIIIKEISAKATYPIRLEVLRKNIPLPYEFQGDLDKDTFHLGAFKNNKLIAVSSYMKSNNKMFKGEQYQLRGMATLTEFQGCGAGEKMMQTAIQNLKNKNIDCLWCNARMVAVEFYKKIGFKIIGEPFDVKFIGKHSVMYVNLT